MKNKRLKSYIMFLQSFILLLIYGCNNQNIGNDININNNVSSPNKRHVSGLMSTSVASLSNGVQVQANSISREVSISTDGSTFPRENWVIPYDPTVIPEDTEIIKIEFIGHDDFEGTTRLEFYALLKNSNGATRLSALSVDFNVITYTYYWQNSNLDIEPLGFASRGNQRFVIILRDIGGVLHTITFDRTRDPLLPINDTPHPQAGSNPTIMYDSSRGRYVFTSIINNPGQPLVRIISSQDGLVWTDDEDEDIALPVLPSAAAAMVAAILGGPAGGGGGGGGGMSVPLPQLAFFIPVPASGEFQPAAICSLESKIIQNCNLSNLPTEQYLVNIVSSDVLIMAVGTQGDVLVSDRFGLNWKVATKLSLTQNMRLVTALVYDELTNIYTIWGYDNYNNLVRLSSENGYYWEDNYIPEFGSIFATNNSYCALESTGKANCWGSNDHNKLGLGGGSYTPTRALVPAKVGGESWPILYTSLAGGSYHMCGIRADDKSSIDCWGSGALGDGIVHDPESSTPIPTQVKIPTNLQFPILSLVGGGLHSCVLDSGNQVWCWGGNQQGEIDATSLQQFFPVMSVANYNKALSYSSIAASDDFTCGIATDQTTNSQNIYCWGKGFSTAANPLYKVTSSELDFGNFLNIGAGGNSACALSNSANSGGTNLWCFGDNTYGQLGNGESGTFTLLPQAVRSDVTESSESGVNPLFFSKIVQSSLNTCGLDKNTNHIYCWGDNRFGQTGVPNAGNIVYEPTLPIQLNGSPGQFTDLSIGSGSICLIAANEGGKLNTYCLGDNSEGQVGTNTTSVRVPDLTIVNTVINYIKK